MLLNYIPFMASEYVVSSAIIPLVFWLFCYVAASAFNIDTIYLFCCLRHSYQLWLGWLCGHPQEIARFLVNLCVFFTESLCSWGGCLSSISPSSWCHSSSGYPNLLSGDVIKNVTKTIWWGKSLFCLTSPGYSPSLRAVRAQTQRGTEAETREECLSLAPCFLTSVQLVFLHSSEFHG